MIKIIDLIFSGRDILTCAMYHAKSLGLWSY